MSRWTSADGGFVCEYGHHAPYWRLDGNPEFECLNCKNEGRTRKSKRESEGESMSKVTVDRRMDITRYSQLEVKRLVNKGRLFTSGGHDVYEVILDAGGSPLLLNLLSSTVLSGEQGQGLVFARIEVGASVTIEQT